MRKALLVAAITVTTLFTGCASQGEIKKLRLSDPTLTFAATGTILSMEDKKRSALTGTNLAAGSVAMNQGGSALGVLALAVDVIDHQAAKDREKYIEVKLLSDDSKQEIIVQTEVLNLRKFFKIGDRARFIQAKGGAEYVYNLTENPQDEEASR